MHRNRENCLEMNDLKWDINWTRSCADVVWYVIGVATLRALVHADDKTSGDARSWYMISEDAKSWIYILVRQQSITRNGEYWTPVEGGDRTRGRSGDQGDGRCYTRWIEKIESVQDISGCRDSQKVKYIAGSFVGKALTWRNSEIHTQGQEATVGMSWEDFKILTREEFYPSNEMQKLETELWNNAMVGAGHAAYTDRFHKLARLVPYVSNPWELRRIEKYVYGLPQQIRGMVASNESKAHKKLCKIAGT
ncbi:reverse transcriptase domain-containing protein [Tanacetum coccineum]|uniref:Reverse transcriptase domain-containing protein n=1 Tax=Tanacetum coccineum TaxID=301880 RepID=A0ABQ5I7E4_9ASTR